MHNMLHCMRSYIHYTKKVLAMPDTRDMAQIFQLAEMVSGEAPSYLR